jgi:hypothetical protein
MYGLNRDSGRKASSPLNNAKMRDEETPFVLLSLVIGMGQIHRRNQIVHNFQLFIIRLISFEGVEIVEIEQTDIFSKR